MSDPNLAEIARLDSELAKLRLQLFQAFYAGAVWCDKNGLPLSANPEPHMEPGFQEWLEKANADPCADLYDVMEIAFGVPRAAVKLQFLRALYGGKKELEFARRDAQAQRSAWVNRITALLALPATAIGDDIAKAVEICVRRCETLELERLKGDP